MVAAAKALCLDQTNVHRQSTKKTAAFVSLAGGVGEHQKLSLNFGVAAGNELINPSSTTSSPANPTMDNLFVSKKSLQPVAQIQSSPAPVRKISGAIARSSSSTVLPAVPSSQKPTAAKENSPNSSDALVQIAGQLKDQLVKAIETKRFDEVSRLIEDIETARLNKIALEISRIGAVVNALRRNVASTQPDLARKCRGLIKSWRTSVEISSCLSRPSSSCGSSTGTPSLVSPAIRLKITPHEKTITPTSLLAQERYTTNASYAPSESKEISPPTGLKRKMSAVSPNSSARSANVKKSKVSPTATQTLSVAEARRNVQPTEQLVAALGMEKFLSSSDKKPEDASLVEAATKSDPIPIPAINGQPSEKRSRKKKTEGQMPVVPRLKIRFGGKPAEEHDKEDAAKASTSSASAETPSTSTEPDTPCCSTEDGKPTPSAKESPKRAFSWWDQVPTIEELEERSKNPPQLIKEPEVPGRPMRWTYNNRTIILMPYLDNGDDDYLYPERMKLAQRRRF